MSKNMKQHCDDWNKFVEFAYTALDNQIELTPVQKTAVLCFWYHSEMCSGGHSGFFDCFDNISNSELIDSMITIGADKCANNFKKAIYDGISSDYEETDQVFYELELEYSRLLEKYFQKNIADFFDINK